MKNLEGVQRQKNLSKSNTNVKRLKELDLPTLDYHRRRQKQAMIEI